MVATTSTEMSGLAAMLSTAAGLPVAPTGAGADFLNALTAALAPSPAATDAAPTSSPTATPTAPAESAVGAPGAATAAASLALQADAVTASALPGGLDDVTVAAASTGAPTPATSSAPHADVVSVSAHPGGLESLTTVAVAPTNTIANSNTTTSGDAVPTVATAVAGGVPAPVVVAPAVQPTQRLAPTARLRSRSEGVASVADTATDLTTSPESADPATPQRTTARRAAQSGLATGTTVPFPPPTVVPVAVIPVVAGAETSSDVPSTSRSAAVESAAVAPGVVAATVPVVAPAPSPASAPIATMPADAAMGAAVVGATAVASAVTAVRPTASKRAASTPGSDTSAPIAPGTTVDRPLPGHRTDAGQSAPTNSAGPRPAGAPAGLGMMGTDRVAKVREQVAGRPMQRLSIELDDARVAIRVRGDKVSVDVTSDPKGALGEGWARQVERTIDRAAKAQDPDSRGTTSDPRSGSNGRRQSQQHRQQREFEIGAWNFAPTPEEES